MLAGVLVQPSVVVVVLLLHEALLDYDCEDVDNDADRDEYVAVEVELGNQIVYLDHVIVGIEDHVTVHQSEECVAADSEVSKSSALPEYRHSEECIANEERNHADQCSSYVWS